ncbi:methyltransferase domain-containing protein [Patescibacteria group bacterium]|nr:methyltransferase domain-containing protein [Patescibacteria group bacterium]MBU4000035.1 methyltransferase domain-containing protein [Patescibacteria group bacterium]MBU4056616.1 methyltransferase domain-containing protein [Patescibacteria group bacterium]MBU4368643.1 methyltransferase domain-containing protein [Patescibacteria group bacterium]
MKYLFVLGRAPTLSIAEILSVFKREGASYKILNLSEEVLAVDLAEPIKNEQYFLDKLGGTIKIIEVFGRLSKVSDLRSAFGADELMDKYPNIKQEIKNIPFPKFYWGVSIYFICKANPHKKQKITEKVKSYLIGIKEVLRERQIRCRIVSPPPHKFFLDSPAVSKNKLLAKGGEIVVAVDKEKIYYGKTLAVQNFRFYGLRDYGRPKRDMKIGMMPPKLAQIMINLSVAEKGGTILDPFCGTGVLLQEALLMGYKVIGSDINKQTLESSRKNLEWLASELNKKSECQLDLEGRLKLFQCDASNLAKFIPQNSIDAIVTEGTLGPRYDRRSPADADIERNFKDLENLYLSAFNAFKDILISGGKVVITFPVYQTRQKKYAFAPFIDKIVKTGYTIISPIEKDEVGNDSIISLSVRKTIIYDRPDQIVGREIVIFSKNA